MRLLGLDRTGAEEAAADGRDERRARIEGVGGAAATLRHRHERRRDHLASSADDATGRDPVAEVGRPQLSFIEVEQAAVGETCEAGRLSCNSGWAWRSRPARSARPPGRQTPPINPSTRNGAKPGFFAGPEFDET